MRVTKMTMTKWRKKIDDSDYDIDDLMGNTKKIQYRFSYKIH